MLMVLFSLCWVRVIPNRRGQDAARGQESKAGLGGTWKAKITGCEERNSAAAHRSTINREIRLRVPNRLFISATMSGETVTGNAFTP